MTEFTDLTFKQLIDEHYKYQQDIKMVFINI